MRHVVMLLCLLALAACTGSPRPFEHNPTQISYGRQLRDKVEVAISPPRNMPPEMGGRVATALAIELQSYGIVAAVAPAEAPIQIDGVMSTRDANMSIEVQVDWRIRGRPRTDEPATVKTRAPPEDYAEQAERLVSRIAQQAAPRIATLIGKPPNFIPRAPGQVAAGIKHAGIHGDREPFVPDGILERGDRRFHRFGAESACEPQSCWIVIDIDHPFAAERDRRGNRIQAD